MNNLDQIPILKKGGIHIKKKNRGSFTRWCNGKVTEECIRRGKNSSNPAIRKKATFAANARKWKHENGGTIKTNNIMIPDIIRFFNGGGIPMFQTPALKLGQRYTLQNSQEIRNDGNNNFKAYPSTTETDTYENIKRTIVDGPRGRDTTLTFFDERGIGTPIKSPTQTSFKTTGTETNPEVWDKYNSKLDELKALAYRFK